MTMSLLVIIASLILILPAILVGVVMGAGNTYSEFIDRIYYEALKNHEI